MSRQNLEKVLVGRDEDLRAAHEMWGQLCVSPDKGPFALTITGDAGTGKTSLLKSIVDQLAPTRTLFGTARATHAAPHDWFATATQQFPRPDPTDDRAWSVLQQDVTEHDIVLPTSAYLRAAQRAIRSLVGEGPALLVVDDLHWLDSASLELWADMSALHGLPALLVVGTRDASHSADPELVHRVISRLQGLAVTDRRHLGGLSLEDTAHLLHRHHGADVPMNRVRRIHRRTNGNPYWLNELIQYGATEDAPLPAHLAALVRSRLSTVPSSARRLARMAALLGDSVSVAFLQELSDDVVSDDVEHLVRVGILHPNPSAQGFPDSVSFDHALAREAIGSSLLPDEATTIHRRALTYAQQRDDWPSIVHHASAIGEDDVTVSASVKASQQYLESWLCAAALDMAKIGLELEPDHRLLLQIAIEAALDIRAMPTARSYLQRLLDTCDEQEVRFNAYLKQTVLAWNEGRVEAAEWSLARAKENADPGSRDLVRWTVSKARVQLWKEDFSGLIELCEEAEAIAESLDMPEHRNSLTITRAMALDHAGDPNEAVRLLEKVWLSAEESGDYRKLPRAINNLLVIQMRRLPETEGRALYERGIAAAGDFGMTLHGGTITRIGADAAIAYGDLEWGIELLSARLPVESNPTERAVHAAKLGLLLVEKGEIELADELLSRSLSEAEAMDKHWVLSYPQWLNVSIAQRRGGPNALRKALDAYRACNSVAEHRRRAHRVSTVARLALEGGIPAAEVRRFVFDCLAQPVATDSFPEADLLLLWLFHHEGDIESAASFSHNNPGWEADLPAYVRAAGWQVIATSYTQLGDLEQARLANQKAMRLLERWPGWRLEQARSQQQQLAVEQVSLTKREEAVLELIAHGASNRHIARELDISQRTVEVHVSRILTKTGSQSRTEAAVWARSRLAIQSNQCHDVLPDFVRISEFLA